MSDHSSLTSSNGEWDRMSQCLSESSLSCRDAEYSDVDSDGTTTGETSAKKCRELLKEEREKTKMLTEENEKLRKLLTCVQPDFTPSEWISEEMIEAEKMIAHLKSKVVLLYKKIIETENKRSSCKTRCERKTLTERIEAMEELCVANSSAIKKSIDMNVRAIENMLKMDTPIEKEEVGESEENKRDIEADENKHRIKEDIRIVDGFLGTYECTSRLFENTSKTTQFQGKREVPITLSITKAPTENAYDMQYTYSDGSKEICRLILGKHLTILDENTLLYDSRILIERLHDRFADIRWFKHGIRDVCADFIKTAN